MARVFSAVDVEDEQLLSRLEEVREKLNLGFNPVSRKKMHITLQFFKDIDEEEIEKVEKAMEEIDLDSFSTDIKGVGAFPSTDYIRVVWAGIDNGQFQELYSQVSDHDVPDDNDHDFMPHITLMRVKNISREKKKKLQRTIREFEDHEFGKLEVNKVKLLESHLDSSNSTYREIVSKELE